MYWPIKPHPHHLCYAACIIAVGLVDLCLQHGPHVPRLNANHRDACFGENAVKPLRQRSSFQPNSLEAINGIRKHLQQSFGLTRHSHFPHDLARIIHNADARFLDRHVESSKIGHAALLLLMLEAALRTSFHHQPEAQHPISSAIHKLVGRLPHLWPTLRTQVGHPPRSEKSQDRTSPQSMTRDPNGSSNSGTCGLPPLLDRYTCTRLRLLTTEGKMLGAAGCAKEKVMRRFLWLVPCFALFLTCSYRATAEEILELNRTFIEQHKNKLTINVMYFVDAAHKKPNPPAKDGDLHAAGRATEIGLATVAE